jgi:nucleotide-binding universal stress UspA family protein
MLERIMIATDGSEISMLAAEMAIDLAKISGAKVIAIYVVDVPRLAHLPGYAAIPGLKDNLMELMLEEGNEAISEIEAMAQDATVACKKVITEGNPSDQLLRRSKEMGVDLIVMGSTGRSGWNKFMIGSVAEKVVRHSQVPVLIVPGPK